MSSTSQTPSGLLMIAESISSIPPSGTPSDYLGRGGQGTEIFVCPDVQIYFIRPDKDVVRNSRPVRLRIVTISADQQVLSSDPTAPAFLEAGGLVYPLIKSQSPIYRSEDGYYLFPDLTSQIPGSTVGIVFPASADYEQRQTFENIIKNLTGLNGMQTVLPDEAIDATNIIKAAFNGNSIRMTSTTQEFPLGEPTPDLANKIAVGIMAVAEVASRGLSASANKTAELIDYGAEYMINHLDHVTEPVHINPDLRQTVAVAKEYSGKVVELSGFAIGKVREGTEILAKLCAYHCQTTANTALAILQGEDETNEPTYFDQFLQVTEGAVNGISMVYTGLHYASKTLASSISYNTVDVMEYCYGPEAGQITQDAVDTVGNVARFGRHASLALPSKLIQRSIKETGKAIFVKEHEPPEITVPDINFQININPDLFDFE